MDGLDTDALFGAFDESAAASRPKPGSSKRPAPAAAPAPIESKRAKPAELVRILVSSSPALGPYLLSSCPHTYSYINS